MDCKISDMLIMKYIDGEISEAEAATLNAHILECEACRKEFYFYDSMVKGFDTLPEIEAPKNFETEVMAKIKALDYSYAEAPRTERRLLVTIAAIFSVIVGGGIALYAFREPIIRVALGTFLGAEAYDKLLDVSGFVGEFMVMIRNTVFGVLSTSSPASSILMGVLAFIVVVMVAFQGYNLYRKRR